MNELGRSDCESEPEEELCKDIMSIDRVHQVGGSRVEKPYAMY